MREERRASQTPAERAREQGALFVTFLRRSLRDFSRGPSPRNWTGQTVSDSVDFVFSTLVYRTDGELIAPSVDAVLEAFAPPKKEERKVDLRSENEKEVYAYLYRIVKGKPYESGDKLLREFYEQSKQMLEGKNS